MLLFQRNIAHQNLASPGHIYALLYILKHYLNTRFSRSVLTDLFQLLLVQRERCSEEMEQH